MLSGTAAPFPSALPVADQQRSVVRGAGPVKFEVEVLPSESARFRTGCTVCLVIVNDLAV
jgi:hypothetical protein